MRKTNLEFIESLFRNSNNNSATFVNSSMGPDGLVKMDKGKIEALPFDQSERDFLENVGLPTLQNRNWLVEATGSYIDLIVLESPLLCETGEEKVATKYWMFSQTYKDCYIACLFQDNQRQIWHCGFEDNSLKRYHVISSDIVRYCVSMAIFVRFMEWTNIERGYYDEKESPDDNSYELFCLIELVFQRINTFNNLEKDEDTLWTVFIEMFRWT